LVAYEDLRIKNLLKYFPAVRRGDSKVRQRQ
jgi:hypothetical protein